MTIVTGQSQRQVALAGGGLLHDEIGALLATDPSRLVVPVREPAELGGGIAALVVAHDGWNTIEPELRAACRTQAVPWIGVHVQLGVTMVGPVEMPGGPGCAGCAELRWLESRPDPAAHRDVVSRHLPTLRERPSSWLTGLGAWLVADVVSAHLRDAEAGRPPCRLSRIDLRELTVETHPFLPHPWCEVCSELPADSPAAARLTLQSRRMYAPGAYRHRDLAGDLDRLEATYVDPAVGVLMSVDDHTAGVLPVAEATVAGFDRQRGHGRADRARASRLGAVLEAVERLAGSPRGRRTDVLASYAEIRDQAIDPRSLGLYPDSWYPQPHGRFRPFADDEPRYWVWGHSFARDEPVLVPEASGYYGQVNSTGPDDQRFVYDCSNGCALGGCLEEAILYGLLEVAERDAFLMTWYGRLPLPRVDVGREGAVALLAATIEAGSGVVVTLSDATMEHGIPCVWAMARNRAGGGRPAAACAAGAHPDPEVAARNALLELETGHARLTAEYLRLLPTIERMVTDPDSVREMADHARLYAHPEAARRLDFLDFPSGTRSLAAVGDPARGGFDSPDLKDNLDESVARYLRCGLDVVVVDQTGPEQAAGGFHCVKVIVPGTVPMTFGHANRRIHGLPRLLEVPRRLGYRATDLSVADLNPHPHPFP